MNKFNTLLTIIYIILFGLILISIFFLKNTNEIIIFDIIQKSNNIGDDLGLSGNKQGVDNIKINKKIGKGFLINKNTFITSAHVLKGELNNYYFYYNSKIFDLNNSELIKKDDIYILKLNNKFKTKKIIIEENTQKGDTVFTIKDNKKIFGEILETNIDLRQINLKSLVKTNIKLIKGDSGSPLFNEKGELIGVFQAIDKNNNSYAKKIAN